MAIHGPACPAPFPIDRASAWRRSPHAFSDFSNCTVLSGRPCFTSLMLTLPILLYRTTAFQYTRRSEGKKARSSHVMVQQKIEELEHSLEIVLRCEYRIWHRWFARLALDTFGQSQEHQARSEVRVDVANTILGWENTVRPDHELFFRALYTEKNKGVD